MGESVYFSFGLGLWKNNIDDFIMIIIYMKLFAFLFMIVVFVVFSLRNNINNTHIVYNRGFS